jgi:cell division FtsZ-interacting protein ZapD
VRYTPKQIEKYRRQKYIAHLEKIGKNLFRMLRDPRIGSEKFLKRFDELMERLDELESIRLDSEYLRESETHYRTLHRNLHESDFDDESFDAMRENGMSELNRLQKMKNRSSYRKEKHRERVHRDGWE